jgi:hypothetical protein
MGTGIRGPLCWKKATRRKRRASRRSPDNQYIAPRGRVLIVSPSSSRAFATMATGSRETTST